MSNGSVDLAVLTLLVDSEGYVRGIRDATQAVDQHANSLDKAAGRVNGLDGAMERLWGRMKQVAAMAGAAWGFQQMAAMGKETVLLAARYSTLGVVLERVRRNVGASSAEISTLETGLRKTGISMVESRQQMLSMIQANINLAQATKLARIAQDAAVIGNVNSSEAFARLIHGLRSGQTEVLRTLGLQINLQQAERKYAQELGKTWQALNSKEKQQARVNEIMKVAKQIDGAYAASMTDAGKILQSTKRYADDLKVTIGSLFKPEFTAFVNAYSNALQNSSTWVKEHGREIQALKIFLTDLMRVMTMMVAGWLAWKALAVGAVWLGNLIAFIGKLIASIAMLGKVMMGTAAIQSGMLLPTLAALISPIGLAAAAILGLVAAFNLYAKAQREARLKEGLNEIADDGVRKAIEANRRAIEDMAKTQLAYQRQLQGATNMGGQTDIQKRVSEQVNKHTKALYDGTMGVVAYTAKLTALRKEYGETIPVLNRAYDEAKRMMSLWQQEQSLRMGLAGRKDDGPVVPPANDETTLADMEAKNKRISFLKEAAQAVAEHQGAVAKARYDLAEYTKEATKLFGANQKAWDANIRARVDLYAEAVAKAARNTRELFERDRDLSAALADSFNERRRSVEALRGEVEALRGGEKAHERYLVQAERKAMLDQLTATMSPELRAALQDEIDQLGMLFDETVRLNKEKALLADRNERMKRFWTDFYSMEAKFAAQSEQKRQEALQPWIAAVQSLAQNMTKVWDDLFQGGKQAFESLASVVTGIIKQMAASIAATLTIKNLGIDQILKRISMGSAQTGNLNKVLANFPILGPNGTILGTGNVGQVSGMSIFGKNNVRGAALGGFVGFGAGYEGGAGAGIAAGALSGGMAGGPVGAIVGAVGGLIGGLTGQSKRAAEAARQMKEASRQWNQSLDEFINASDPSGNGSLKQRQSQLKDQFGGFLQDLFKNYTTNLSDQGRAIWDNMTKNLSTKDWANMGLDQLEQMRATLRRLLKGTATDFSQFASDFNRMAEAQQAYQRLVEQAQRRAEEEVRVRQEDLQLRTLSARLMGVTNPELAAQLEREQQIADHRRQQWEAAEAGWTEAERAALDLAQAEEVLGLARKQALEAAEREREARRAMEDLAVRLTRARDGDSAAEEQAFQLAQLREVEDALTAQRSEGYMALLALVHAEERARMERERAEELVRKAEEQRRFAASLTVRQLEAQGKAYDAALAAFDEQTAQEIFDAMAEEMDEGALASIRLTRALERERLLREQEFDKMVNRMGVEARVLELTGRAKEAEALRRHIAVAQEIKDAQALLDAGAITQELFDQLRDALLGTLDPALQLLAEHVAAAAGILTDTAASLLSTVQGLANQALGLVGATAEQSRDYSLGLARTNPILDSILGNGDAASAYANAQQWITRNLRLNDPTYLAQLPEEQRNNLQNVLNALTPFMQAFENWFKGQEAPLPGLSPTAPSDPLAPTPSVGGASHNGQVIINIHVTTQPGEDAEGISQEIARKLEKVFNGRTALVRSAYGA